MALQQLIDKAQAHPPVMFVAGIALAAALILLLGLVSRALGGSGAKKAGGDKVFLDATKFQPVPLSKVDRLSHNTLRLRFDLPEPDMRVGLPIGQHITFSARGDDGKDVFRPYTPVTDDDALGSVEFVIKVYPAGKMSQVVAGLRVGDTMAMKGPRGRFAYKRNQWKQIGETLVTSGRCGGDGDTNQNDRNASFEQTTPTQSQYQQRPPSQPHHTTQYKQTNNNNKQQPTIKQTRHAGGRHGHHADVPGRLRAAQGPARPHAPVARVRLADRG
jgi:hypothetical protein